jgi:hypothetical protein
MKIKVITGHKTGTQGPCCYSKLTVTNMQEYCSRHGYEFIAKLDGWSGRPWNTNTWEPTWLKVDMAQSELSGCDWLVWLDIDVMVLNMTTRMESLLGDGANMVATAPFEPCIGCGRPVHNTGIFFFRNCKWSHDILDQWWLSRHVQLQNSVITDYHWPQKYLDRWWDNQRVDETLPETGGCPWLGEMGYFSCRLCHNPRQTDYIKIIPMTVAGWATITGSPLQFLTHQYGSTEVNKYEMLESLLPQVIR